MTTKRYMQQYRRWRATYENKLAELKTIEMDCILPPGIRYDKDKIMSSPDGDGMIKLIEQLESRRKDILDDMRRQREKMQRFEDMVNSVEDADHKRLLHLYYIEDLRTLRDVAKAMDYSIDYINHMHGEALTEIGKIIKLNNK